MNMSRVTKKYEGEVNQKVEAMLHFTVEIVCTFDDYVLELSIDLTEIILKCERVRPVSNIFVLRR